MPVVIIYSRPHSRQEREEMVDAVTRAISDAYSLQQDAVQVFVVEADDDHWAKGGRLGGSESGAEAE